MIATYVLTCTNCQLEHRNMSVLYCAECEQHEDEPWFAWRDRLAARRRTITEGAAVTDPRYIAVTPETQDAFYAAIPGDMGSDEFVRHLLAAYDADPRREAFARATDRLAHDLDKIYTVLP